VSMNSRVQHASSFTRSMNWDVFMCAGGQAESLLMMHPSDCWIKRLNTPICTSPWHWSWIRKRYTEKVNPYHVPVYPFILLLVSDLIIGKPTDSVCEAPDLALNEECGPLRWKLSAAFL